VGDKRDPEQTPKLDDESNRGKTSKDGFGDYDKEFHPADVETDTGDSDGGKEASSRPKVTEERLERTSRVEVHFHTMIIRNRGAAMDGQITSW
jgi:hypothetical protein